MTEAPTRSLRASVNPQARMQELLKQTSPAVVPEETSETLPVAQATALPQSNATSSTEAIPHSDLVASANSSEVAQTRRKPDVQKRNRIVLRKDSEVDPVRQAMLGMLAMPYPEDMDEGGMTVTSVKIPKPIWERLEYARTLTKKDKQDIIADALRIYFELIVEGGLEK